MRINPNPEFLLTRFLYYQLTTQLLRNEITGRAQGANPTMKKINKTAVQTLPIVVPPIPEQSRIVAHLDAVRAETESLERLYREKLASLDELRRSVLAEAFS